MKVCMSSRTTPPPPIWLKSHKRVTDQICITLISYNNVINNETKSSTNAFFFSFFINGVQATQKWLKEEKQEKWTFFFNLTFRNVVEIALKTLSSWLWWWLRIHHNMVCASQQQPSTIDHTSLKRGRGMDMATWMKSGIDKLVKCQTALHE